MHPALVLEELAHIPLRTRRYPGVERRLAGDRREPLAVAAQLGNVFHQIHAPILHPLTDTVAVTQPANSGLGRKAGLGAPAQQPGGGSDRRVGAVPLTWPT
jgi:hypothetical protein